MRLAGSNSSCINCNVLYVLSDSGHSVFKTNLHAILSAMCVCNVYLAACLCAAYSVQCFLLCNLTEMLSVIYFYSFCKQYQPISARLIPGFLSFAAWTAAWKMQSMSLKDMNNEKAKKTEQWGAWKIEWQAAYNKQGRLANSCKMSLILLNFVEFTCIY